MANFEVVVPRLGESVIEVTLTKWLKNEGDAVEQDEALVEIATDKVDSEIVSPVAGKLVRKLSSEGAVVSVGRPIALMELAAENPSTGPAAKKTTEEPVMISVPAVKPAEADPVSPSETQVLAGISDENMIPPSHTRYYSPLVRNIARQEGVSVKELDGITGSGKDDRVTKQDILNFLQTRKSTPPEKQAKGAIPHDSPAPPEFQTGEDRIIEMDRIRQLISAHMVRSVQTSPHVTSFLETDMSRIVHWREQNKEKFAEKYNEKLTYTPILVEAIAKAVRDFPMINVSVDGNKILVHSRVNIGMAVALPGNNLIVPVVRDAGKMNLLGIIRAVNDLANRARLGKLVPDEISGGTISLTNLGSFGTLMGTPIINQPQTAIVAAGVIKKRAVVLETPEGDVIGIRPVMMCSITFDHRVIDGALGGQFLSRFVKYLEQFDQTQTI